MSIYEMTNKEMRKEIRSFGKTTYGKVVICLSYIIPLVAMVVAIEFLVFAIQCNCFACYKPAIVITLVFMFVSFVLGSRYYYKELKGFIEKQNSDK